MTCVFHILVDFQLLVFLKKSRLLKKSRTDPFFLKTSDYTLNSDYNQKSEIQHLKLPVRTCITVATGPKTVLFNPGIRNRLQGIDSASLRSQACRYYIPILTRFPALIDCSKIPALESDLKNKILCWSF